MSNTFCNFAEMITSKVMEKKKRKEWKDFKFNLFGTTWKVHFVEEIPPRNAEDDSMHFGQCDGGKNIIEIAYRGHGGVQYSEEVMRATLYHEIVHAILGTGQYNNSCNDEPLVEWVARCLMSLNSQNVFEYAKK